MLRSPLLAAFRRPLQPQITTIPVRTPLSPLRKLTTYSPRITPTFFRPHTLPLRSQSRFLSLHVPPVAFSARHPYIAIGARFVFSTFLGLGVLVGVILFHDAFTYSERHVDRVPANPLALHPKLGGKKGLPVLEVNLDEEEEGKRSMEGKPRLVIIGGGWGVRALPLQFGTQADVPIGRRTIAISPGPSIQRHPHLSSNVLRLHPAPTLRLRRDRRGPDTCGTAAQDHREGPRSLYHGISRGSGYGAEVGGGRGAEGSRGGDDPVLCAL